MNQYAGILFEEFDDLRDCISEHGSSLRGPSLIEN